MSEQEQNGRDFQEDIKEPGIFNRVFTFLLFSRRGLIILGLIIGLAIFFALVPPGTISALFNHLWHHRRLAGLLLLFSLVTLSLLFSTGQRLDARLFLYINQHKLRAFWLSAFMFLITQIGTGLFSFILAGIFYLLGDRRLGVELFLGTLTLWLVVETIKALVERSRPFLLFEETQVVGWRAIGKSFPSGHTAQTFFMVSLLVFHFQPYAFGTALFYLLAVVVGFSRIYNGVHYPRDVLAGAVLGLAWGALGGIMDPYWHFLT